MRKFLSATLILILTLTLLLVGCVGQKAVENIEILEGFKYEYELDETPDFSGVKARIVYNDGTTKEVTAAELGFGKLDTSVVGKKDVTVSYGEFSKTFTVEVKGKSATEVTRELESIEYFSGLPSVVYVNDPFLYETLIIKANYSDGTAATIKLSENSSVKHSDIDTSKAGTQQLTLTYMGKTTTVDVVITEIALSHIEVDGDSIPVTTEGTAFDPTGLIVYAYYNNSTTGVQIPLSDLEIVESNGKVLVSYQGKTTEISVQYTAPVILSMEIATTGYEVLNNSIILGDSFSTALVTAKAKLNNGGTRAIANSDLDISIDVSKAGTATLTATLKENTDIKATAEITVLGIVSVQINTSSVKNELKEGDELDVSGIKVLVLCTDGNTYERTQNITVNSDNIDNTRPNTGTSYITASFGGVESDKLYIKVLDKNLSFFIIDVEQPEQLSEIGINARKINFLNTKYNYVVGDDNPFIYKLSLTILNESNVPVTGYDEYVSYFELWYNGEMLTGAELAKYAEFHPSKNSIDFTEAAIGKIFTIKTRPRDGVDYREEAMTRELTVEVVDGYNIYEAWELNYLTNMNDYQVPTSSLGQHELVDKFLEGKNATRPTNLAGIVLHNTVSIGRDDIPPEYFVGGDPDTATAIHDCLTVFPHTNDSNLIDENGRRLFTFYGNHFTIYSYELPNVDDNNGDGVSNGQLFRFTASGDASNPQNGNYDHTKYVTYIKSLFLKDNEPNKDNLTTADRDKLGLIAMKVCYQEVFIENIHVEAFYISFFADHDYLTVNINESILFNSWQNHISLYSDNLLQEETDYPREHYPALTVNITNSEITKCGGPVIISQTRDTTENRHTKSGGQVSIDSKTEIWTWVTGSEAWFESMGVSAIALQMSELGEFLVSNGKTFISLTNEKGVTSDEGYYFMNMVMVNLPAGNNPAELFMSANDVDGKLTIDGKAYLDMNDTATGTYGDATISANAGVLGNVATGGTAVCSYTGGAIVLNADKQPVGGANPTNIVDGDYIAVYKGNLGLVFGYYPFNVADGN